MRKVAILISFLFFIFVLSATYAVLAQTALPDTAPPSVPQNLTATSTSATSITLYWSPSADNVGVSGYHIYRNGTKIASTSGTKYTNSYLALVTAYTYTVAAYDKAGNVSAQSASATATTIDTAKPTISSVAVKNITASSADIIWTTNEPATGQVEFGLYGATCCAFSSPVLSQLTATHTVNLLGLASATTYSYRVKSKDAAGNLKVSSSYSFKTLLAPSTKFSVGDRVQTTATLSVRATPSIYGTLLGSQIAGASGVIAGGPYYANGYWWWKVDYSNNIDGWSVENYLAVIDITPPTVSLNSVDVKRQPPYGVHALGLSGDSVDDIATMITNPNIDAIFASSQWDKIEISDNVSDWSSIDRYVEEAAKAGKKVSIGVRAGIATPQWVYDLGASSFLYKEDQYYAKNDFCIEKKIPLPWDPIFLAKWKEFIGAFGNRYANNPAISHIKITVVNDRTLETMLPKAKGQVVTDPDSGTSCTMYNDIANWQNAGYTRVKVKNAWKEMADAFALSFPNHQLSVMVPKAGFPPIDDFGAVIPNSTGDSEIVPDMLNIGIADYGARFIAQNNGLSATSIPSHVVAVKDAVTTGYQMLWYVTNDPTCRMNNKVTPCDAASMLQSAVQKGVDNGAAFLEVYKMDIKNSGLQDILKYARTALMNSPKVVSGTIRISADASDNKAINNVRFYANETMIGEDASGPHEILWDTAKFADGKYSITAIATDGAGNSATSTALSLIVNN